MQKILLPILALVFFLPAVFTADINPVLPYDGKEKFNPSLARLNSIYLLEKYTDSIASAKQLVAGSYEYVELLESVVEERFYHGFSHFSPSQNWMAAFAGKFIKEDYACIVEPDKIMQHPNAACSQQALVMMQILRNKKMAYRSLGFPHHYAMEVAVQNEWYFFDANMEPGLTKEQRALSTWKRQNDKLKQHYDKSRHTHLDFQFGSNAIAYVGNINEVPARKAKIFHVATAIASKLLFFFPLLLIFFKPRFRMNNPFISFLNYRKKPSVSLSAQ